MPDPIRTQADALLAPVLAAIQQQKLDEQKRAANAQATAGASAQGLSQALAPIPGQIEATYKRAGDTTSAYAKGFSTAFQAGSEQTASELNAFLAQQGGPQQVQSAGAKGADVLYGLGGYIPASGLAREGAAFSAAAEAFPASALLRGQENQALIGRESGEKQAQFDALARTEKAKLPGLIQDITRSERAYKLDLRQDARAERGLGFQERELKLREEAAREPNHQIFGSGETGYMTFDAKTGRVTRLTAPAPAGAAAPELIGSGETGYYAWNATDGTITPVLAAPAKPKFTAKELRDIKLDAADIARHVFWGRKDKDGVFTAEPLHYQQALAVMLNEQIPLEIAQSALNKYWQKPGFWADVASRKLANGNPRQVRWIDFKKQSAKGVTGRPLKPIQERKPQGEVDPAAEANANAYGGTTVLKVGPNSAVPGWNDKSIPPKIKNVIAIAHAQVGKPYVWGGESPSEGGFDCSGLIEYAFEQAGIPTPGRLTTQTALQLGKPVKGSMKPGDWIITNGGKHMVMYVGKGQVIAAPRRGETIQYQPVSRFRGSIVAVRRFA